MARFDDYFAQTYLDQVNELIKELMDIGWELQNTDLGDLLRAGG